MSQQHLDRLSSIDASFLTQRDVDQPHARRRGADLRGTAAELRGLLEQCAAACRWCRDFARSWRCRRCRRAGRSGSTTRASTSPTTCATPRCPRRAARSSCGKLAGRVFSQQLDRSKPLWELWLVQGLERNRFALVSKTHHAMVDGVSGVDISTVLFDVKPVPEPAAPRTKWAPSPEPSTAELVAKGVTDARRGAVIRLAAPLDRRRPAPRSHRSQARRRRSRRSARSPGRFADPAPEVPLNTADRLAPALRLGALGAGDVQARSRTRSAAPSTTSCSRSSAAPCGAGCGPGRAHRGPGAAGAGPGLDPHRGRARPARQPDRRYARPAAGLRRGPGARPADRPRGDGGPEAGPSRRSAPR